MNSITVQEYLDEYLRNVAALTVRPRTFENYERNLQLYVYPRIGDLYLVDLRIAVMEEFYRDLTLRGNRTSGPLSSGTVRQVHAVLRRAFARAVAHELIPQNPAQVTTLPKVNHRQIDMLSSGEIGRLHKLVQEEQEDRPLATAIAISLHTGMRRGEVLGLQWGDINLCKGTIHIARSLHSSQGSKPIYGDPKTKKSRRTLAMTDSLKEILIAHKSYVSAELQKSNQRLEHSTPVILRKGGGVIHPNALTNASKHFFKAHQLPNSFSFHGLRHVHASYLIAANVPLKVISERLGHSSISITLDTYGHILEGQDNAAAEAFNRIVHETTLS